MTEVKERVDRMIQDIMGIAPPPRPPIDPPPRNDENGGMEIEKRLAVIEATLPTLATKADGEVLRADIHKMDASVKTWMVATIVGLFFGFAGLFFAMNNAQKPASAPAAQPPIIINVPAAAAVPAPAASQK